MIASPMPKSCEPNDKMLAKHLLSCALGMLLDVESLAPSREITRAVRLVSALADRPLP